jgi:hypothetical protein
VIDRPSSQGREGHEAAFQRKETLWNACLFTPLGIVAPVPDIASTHWHSSCFESDVSTYKSTLAMSPFIIKSRKVVIDDLSRQYSGFQGTIPTHMLLGAHRRMILGTSN